MILIRFLDKKRLLLLALFFLGLFLRLYNLNNVPVGFHGDEAEIGYNTYSLLKTGRDKNGLLLPLATDQFGDFRPSGYQYTAIIPVAVFGLNEFATRFPAAFFGSLTIILFFLLTKELFNDENLGIIGAFVLTFNPWHVVTSRATSESIIALFFVILGVFIFLKATKTNNPNLSTLSFAYLFFALSFLFYHAARFFTPILAILLTATALLVNNCQKKTKKHLIILNISLLIVFIIVFIAANGLNRPLSISIFNTQETKLILEEQIREDAGQNVILARLLHNKIINYTLVFFDNYFQHFTANFLFLKGGFPHRYSVPWTGNFYMVDLPFMLFGVSFLIVNSLKKRSHLFFLPILWVLTGPIPAAFTFEDLPNVQRSIMMLPALIIVIAYGFSEFVKLIKQSRIRKVIFLTLLGIFSYNFLFFLHNYFHHSFVHQPWYRSVGEKELVMTVQQLAKEYDQIIMTSVHDNNLIFHLFYRQFDPKLFQELGSPKDKDGLKFENLVFTYDHCPLKGDEETEAEGEEQVIYVNRGECEVPLNAEKIKVVNRTDGTDAFQILKLK